MIGKEPISAHRSEQSRMMNWRYSGWAAGDTTDKRQPTMAERNIGDVASLNTIR
jgi:hypothetical protein